MHKPVNWQSVSRPSRAPMADALPLTTDGTPERVSPDASPLEGVPSAGRPRVVLRAVVLGWCIWLLGVWCGSLWIDSTVPAARWMIFSALIGLMALWPAVRLSIDEARAIGCGEPMVEWLALNVVFQAVVWPLSLSARWSLEQTLWLDAAVMGWSCLTSLLIANGIRCRRVWPRVAMMLLCVMLVLAEPAAAALLSVWGTAGFVVMHISPIQTVWALTDMPVTWESGPWRSNVLVVIAAATIGWTLLVLIGRQRVR